MFANPSGRFHPFDLSLSFHCRLTRVMCFGPNKFPGLILAGEVSIDIVGFIVKFHSGSQVFCLPDVKLAARILEDVDPKDDSSGRTRTYNPDSSGLTAATPS